jgi:hypothetical protein
MGLEVVPVTFAQVREFIAKHHRHNKPPVSWKFGCGVMDGAQLVGVASAGRPVSRVIQTREPRTVEVNRTCTDGTRNANSMLYGAIWRAAKALGYDRAFTYIQADEDGASLRAAGWVKVKDIAPRGSWADHSVAREGRDDSTGGVARQLWEIRR